MHKAGGLYVQFLELKQSQGELTCIWKTEVGQLRAFRKLIF